jgi:hypothetical protein
LRVSPRIIAPLLLAACASSSVDRPELIPSGRVALAFRTLDNRVMTLGGLRGRVVLVTVMYTWAETALIEVPRYKTLAKQYDASELAIVSIVLDEHREMARIFAETFEIPYLVATVDEPESFGADNGPLGPIKLIPTSLLIDREGRIAARADGIWPPDVLENAVGRLVATDRGQH